MKLLGRTILTRKTKNKHTQRKNLGKDGAKVIVKENIKEDFGILERINVNPFYVYAFKIYKI